MASGAVVAAVAARATQVAQSLVLPPHDGQVLSVVDMHTGGEPVRILISGLPQIRGSTLLTKRRYVSDSMDSVRCVLMWEPRGHRDMYGVLLVESELPEAHFGVLFMHNEGYSTMCGHAVLALARFAVDQKLVTEPTSPETQVNLHCPCGLVTAYVEYEKGKTGRARFHSVPAFVFATGDAGYPLKRWLLTPVRNPQNQHEEDFNRAHARTRVVIEQAFGLLKARFRCLSRSGGALLYRHEKVAKIVMACVMLHNMCFRRNVPLPPDADLQPPDDEDDEGGDGAAPQGGSDAQEGREMRQNLIDQCF